MEFRTIVTGNISSLDHVEGSAEWLWGTDYTYGDLYEAEELFESGHRIVKNRLILVNRNDDTVHEPCIAENGMYFGRPVYAEGKIMILMADFSRKRILILSYQPRTRALNREAIIPRSGFRDCYNLMLKREPLILSRADAHSFEIIWPVQKTFETEPSETFCFMHGTDLYFSRWFEDPDYREETVVRDLMTGEITANVRASLVMDGAGVWRMLKESE